jgi:hypothetical protein
MAGALKDPFGALNALKGSFRASRRSRYKAAAAQAA